MSSIPLIPATGSSGALTINSEKKGSGGVLNPTHPLPFAASIHPLEALPDETMKTAKILLKIKELSCFSELAPDAKAISERGLVEDASVLFAFSKTCQEIDWFKYKEELSEPPHDLTIETRRGARSRKEAEVTARFSKAEEAMLKALFEAGNSRSKIAEILSSEFKHFRSETAVNKKIILLRRSGILSPATKRRSYTMKERNLMIQLYRDGKTKKQIATELFKVHRSTRTEHSVKGEIAKLKKEGVLVTLDKYKRYTELELTLLKRLHEEGNSRQEIARTLFEQTGIKRTIQSVRGEIGRLMKAGALTAHTKSLLSVERAHEDIQGPVAKRATK